MDPQQFSQFIQLEQDDRERSRRAAKESNERQKAESQAKRINKCDGSTTKAVREWMQEVELTIPYTPRTVFVAAHSAEGALRRELERHLDEALDRNTVTWAALREHLQQAFLSPFESDRLRDEVEKVKQTGYESTSVYGRKFRDAADLGYPPAGRNEDQNRTLLRAYLKGLRDRCIVERLIKEGRPETFMDAMTLVQGYESDEYLLNRALEGVITREEPMEVDQIRQKPRVETQAGSSKELENIQRQVSGLSRQFTKLMGELKNTSGPRPASGATGREFKFGEDGRPICAYCQKAGHLWRNCRLRLGLTVQNPAPSGDQ